jgi:hypothetical protein
LHKTSIVHHCAFTHLTVMKNDVNNTSLRKTLNCILGFANDIDELKLLCTIPLSWYEVVYKTSCTTPHLHFYSVLRQKLSFYCCACFTQSTPPSVNQHVYDICSYCSSSCSCSHTSSLIRLCISLFYIHQYAKQWLFANRGLLFAGPIWRTVVA